MSYSLDLTTGECMLTFDIAIGKLRFIKTARLLDQVLHEPIMKKLKTWKRIHNAVIRRERAQIEGRPFDESKYPDDAREAFKELDELTESGNDSDDSSEEDSDDEVDENRNQDGMNSNQYRHQLLPEFPIPMITELPTNKHLNKMREISVDSPDPLPFETDTLSPSKKRPIDVDSSNPTALQPAKRAVFENRQIVADSADRMSSKTVELMPPVNPAEPHNRPINIGSTDSPSPNSAECVPSEKRINTIIPLYFRYVSTQIYSPLAHYSH